MTTTISEEGCDGCLVYPAVKGCFYNSIEGCPCKGCLIKMMCVRDCADLIAHTKKRDNAMKAEKANEKRM